jgi:parvulin-like peptidyl-prolyl isomerase
MKSLSVFLLTVLTAAPALAQPKIANGIAALANDAIITYQEVQDYAFTAVDLLARTYFSQPEVFEVRRRETMNKALEDLVEKQLMLDEFKAQGGVLPDGILEDQIKARIREAYGGDRSALTRTLKAQGINMEVYRRRIREEIIVNYMRMKNISQAILISPAKIELHYATNLAQFKVGEEVKLRVIVLRAPVGSQREVLGRMEEILAKIEEGADFAEMASTYSEGSQGREAGDWKWIDRTVLQRGLSDVAFALSPGQHSSVIGRARETRDDHWTYYLYDKTGRVRLARRYQGSDMVEETKFDAAPAPLDLPLPPEEFFLIKVEDRRSARTRTLDEVRDEIEKDLVAAERARLQKRWTRRLREKSFVRYF